MISRIQPMLLKNTYNYENKRTQDFVSPSFKGKTNLRQLVVNNNFKKNALKVASFFTAVLGFNEISRCRKAEKSINEILSQRNEKLDFNTVPEIREDLIDSYIYDAELVEALLKEKDNEQQTAKYSLKEVIIMEKLCRSIPELRENKMKNL